MYLAYDLKNKRNEVAVKTESLKMPYSHLLKEIQIAKVLEGVVGFPRLLNQGIALENQFVYMVS